MERLYMRILFLTVTTFLVSFTANAEDACSTQLKSYMSGLEAGATLAAVNKSQRDKAIKQIDYIKKLQETLPDCRVVDYIPVLKANKKSLEFASEQIKNKL